MVADLGRKLEFTWGGASIGKVREKSFALAGEPVDVTSDDDDGFRTLLAEAGENTIDFSVSGVTLTDILKVDWFGGTRTKTVVATYSDGGVISGEFFLASYTDTGVYNDAVTFEASFQSTGPFTYTPGTPSP